MALKKKLENISRKNRESPMGSKKTTASSKKKSPKVLTTISKALKKSRRRVSKTSPVRVNAKVVASKPITKTTLRRKKNTAFSIAVSLNRKKPSPSSAPAIQPYQDLPFSYNVTKLALLARDPLWAYTFWDFSTDTWNWIQDLRHKKNGLRSVLRIKNLDDHSFFDVDIQLETKNWYVHIGIPDASFESELGLIDSTGKYHLIVKSNRIRMPRNGPSHEIDSHWQPDFFDEIYKLSGGGAHGRSSDIASQYRRRP